MYGGIFFLVVLGAYGLDALPSIKEKYIKRWYALISAAVGFFLLIIAFLNILTPLLREKFAILCMGIFSHTVYGHGPFTKDIPHYRDATIRGIEAWQEFTSLLDPSFLWPTVVLIASLLTIWLLLYKKISATQFKLSIFLISVVTFISLVSFPFKDRLYQSNVHELNAHSFMQFVQESDTQQYRYYPIFLADAYQKLVPPTYQLNHDQINASVEMGFSTGWPNTNFIYDMPSVDGYDVFVSTAYIDSLALMGSTFGAQDYTRSIPLEEKIGRFNATLSTLGMMGGKYIVSGVELNNSSLTLLGTYTSSNLNIKTYVYNNSLALPIAYFIKKGEEAPDMPLPTLIASGKTNFQNVTYLDCKGCIDTQKNQGHILSEKYENGRALFTVETVGSAWLIFSQTMLPGWHIRIDGKESNLVRANGLYMAVSIPSGRHGVEFVYHGELNRGI
jgi:hypothetical protein